MYLLSSRRWVLNCLLLAALLLGAALLPAPTLAAPASAAEQSGDYHVVRPGETLTKIAQLYGVTVYALMRANMISDPNTIYVSQRLVIPSESMGGDMGMGMEMGGDMGSGKEMGGEMEMMACRGYHTVQPHETGFDIAREYGVSSYSLVEANGLVDINTVYAGMKLCIPNTPYPVNEPASPKPDMEMPERPMPKEESMPDMGPPMHDMMPMPKQDGMCTYHMVRQGETLSNIAMMYGVNVYQVMKLNNISNPNKIYAGQKLTIDCGEGWMPEPMPMPEARPKPEPKPEPRPEPKPKAPASKPEPEPNMKKGAAEPEKPQHKMPESEMGKPDPMPEHRPMPEPMPMPMPERRPMPEPMPMPPMEGHKSWMEIEQGPWWGYYYCDKYFGGEPVIMREDYDIRFNWRGGSPGEMVPEDRFSAKWERTAKLEGGWYRWVAKVDDGVRIYVDDQLVLDAWREQPETEYTADFFVKPGYHKFRVEYYEESNMASISVKLERR